MAKAAAGRILPKYGAMVLASTSLALTLGSEYLPFNAELVIDERDKQRCVPAMYLPYYPLDDEPSQAAKDAAFAQFVPTAEGVVNNKTSVVFLNFNAEMQDDTRYTPPLQLLSYGRQIVRLYAPTHYYIDGEKKETKPNIKVYAGLSDISIENNVSAPYGYKGNIAAVKLSYEFYSQKFERTYIVNAENSDKQIKHNGRKTTYIRETLKFNGEKEKTIKYHYDNPVVSVLSSTEFKDIHGNSIKPPDNISTGENYWLRIKYSDPRLGKSLYKERGHTFRSSERAYGSLIVEYQTSYDEYEIYYDAGELKQPYSISCSIEPVGSAIYSKATGDFIESKPHPLITHEIEKTEDSKTERYKLFKKINFSSVQSPSIDVLCTNGDSAATLSFSAAVHVAELSKDDLPKVVIYQEREREKVTGDGDSYVEVEHVKTSKYIDMLGNVDTENIHNE